MLDGGFVMGVAGLGVGVVGAGRRKRWGVGVCCVGWLVSGFVCGLKGWEGGRDVRLGVEGPLRGRQRGLFSWYSWF